MNIREKFNENLSKMLFLELKKNKKIGQYILKDNIYVPIKSEKITSKAKEGDNLKEIPISFFLEGMFYVMGADNKFRFNEIYKEIITSIQDSIPFIKNNIYKKVKAEKIEDAYILTKGLSMIEPTTEVYDRLLVLLERLKVEQREFEEEELSIIEEAKKIPNYPQPYLYESLVYRDKGQYKKAMVLLQQYIKLGGEQTKGVLDFKGELEKIHEYDTGRELCKENPEKALTHLLPLVDYFEDMANIYYYIAVSYRILGDYAKAIYYLNEAYSRDEALIEVVNEYGINYANIGEFEKASKYFERAFREVKSVEICTNIVMSYLNLKDYESAKKYLNEAKKIAPEDEIVLKLEAYFPEDDIKNTEYKNN